MRPSAVLKLDCDCTDRLDGGRRRVCGGEDIGLADMVGFWPSICLLFPWLVASGRLCGKRDAERRAFLRLVLQFLLGRPAKGKETAAPILPTRRRSNWLTEAAVLARGTLLQRDGRCQQMDTAQVWEFASDFAWHRQPKQSKDETDGRRTNVVEEINPIRPRSRRSNLICCWLAGPKSLPWPPTMTTIVHAIYLRV